MQRNQTTKTGREYEGRVCEYLQRQGMKILERNYTIRGGEIDIIASDDEFICFVEVKFRSVRATDAYSSVGFRKQQRIIKTAYRYLYENGCDLQPRFDVVFIFNDDGETCFEYYKNAYSSTY